MSRTLNQSKCNTLIKSMSACTLRDYFCVTGAQTNMTAVLGLVQMTMYVFNKILRRLLTLDISSSDE